MDRTARKTVFCDIDGTLLEHNLNLHSMVKDPPVLLPDVVDVFQQWREQDYYIVITTARPEGTRRITEDHLLSCGLFWDQMIMGLPTGSRMVINDKKPNGMVTAEAFCIERNEGLTRFLTPESEHAQ